MRVEHKDKIFVQIFLSFFFLFFLVLIGVSYNQYSVIEREMSKENVRVVDGIVSGADINMEFLENYMDGFKSNSDFLNYITKNDATPEEIYRVQRFLRKDSQMFGRDNLDIGIVNLDKASVIFSEETFNVYDYQRIMKLKLFNLTESFINIEGDYIVKYIPYQQSRNSDRVLYVVRLKKDYMKRIFKESEGIKWYIKGSGGYIDLDDLRESLDASDLKSVETNGLLKGKVFYRITTDKREISYELFWKLLLGMFIIYGLSYFLAKLIFKITYNPLEESLETLEDSNSKHINEYLKLKELMIKVKRENSQVEEKLENSMMFLSSKYLKEFLQGIIDYGELSERLPESCEILKKESYQIVIIKRISREEVYMREAETLIKSEVDRMVGESCRDTEVLDINNNLTAYICSYNETGKDDLKKLMEYFNNKYSVKLEIAITDKLNTLTEVQREYTSLIKYFDYTLGSENIVTKENIDETLKSKYYYPISIEQDFIDKISKGDTTLAKAMIVKVFYENLQERRISREEEKTLQILMLNTLRRLINILETDDSVTKKIEGLINKLSFTEIAIFEDEYLKSLDYIIEGAVKTEKKEKVDLRERVEEFIINNYMYEITLQDLADHTGYSQHYMSYVFKGLFKESFRSKINTYRIEKAKEIMAEEPNLKVYEIAKKVGYNSSSSFIKIFKSIEGCSPGVYREK